MASGVVKLKLYSYFQSSCSYRVRIALKLKRLEYEYKSINLQKGEQFSPEFTEHNPMGYVPVLVDEDIVVSDSFAILMYLEEKYPQHPLLPSDLQRRAINYQAANIVSSSIQPFQNRSVLVSNEAGSMLLRKLIQMSSMFGLRITLGKGMQRLRSCYMTTLGNMPLEMKSLWFVSSLLSVFNTGKDVHNCIVYMGTYKPSQFFSVRIQILSQYKGSGNEWTL